MVKLNRLYGICRKIREKLKVVYKMDNEFGTLRKKAFGGFNPKDVVDCIEKTRNELHEYKTSAQKTIEELKEKVEKLESEKTALEKVNADLAKANAELIEGAKVADNSVETTGDSLTVIEINAATNELKKVADDLCNSLRDFMDRIAQNSISVVVENSESEPEENFDAEKFMAELEAEIYAKLGVESDNGEVTVEVFAEEAKADKVAEIMAQTDRFAQISEKKETVIKEEAPAKKNILDILSKASFAK